MNKIMEVLQKLEEQRKRSEHAEDVGMSIEELWREVKRLEDVFQSRQQAAETHGTETRGSETHGTETHGSEPVKPGAPAEEVRSGWKQSIEQRREQIITAEANIASLQHELGLLTMRLAALDAFMTNLDEQRKELKQRVRAVQLQVAEATKMQYQSVERLKQLQESQVARYAVDIAKEELAVNAAIIRQLEASQARVGGILEKYEERKKHLSELLERTQSLIAGELSQTIVESHPSGESAKAPQEQAS